jgi:hypothetical protein
LNTRRLVLTSSIVLSVAGCGQDPSSPAEREDAPALRAPDLAVASNSWISRADLPGDQAWGYTLATVPNAKGQSIVYVMGG